MEEFGDDKNQAKLKKNKVGKKLKVSKKCQHKICSHNQIFLENHCQKYINSSIFATSAFHFETGSL